MRPCLLPALVPFLGSALAANGIAFTNPPPPGGLLEPANNPVYAEGSTIQISWSGKAQIAFSVVLYTIGVTPDGGYDIPNDREPTADILGKSPCLLAKRALHVHVPNQPALGSGRRGSTKHPLGRRDAAGRVQGQDVLSQFLPPRQSGRASAYALVQHLLAARRGEVNGADGYS